MSTKKAKSTRPVKSVEVPESECTIQFGSTIITPVVLNGTKAYSIHSAYIRDKSHRDALFAIFKGTNHQSIFSAALKCWFLIRPERHSALILALSKHYGIASKRVIPLNGPPEHIEDVALKIDPPKVKRVLTLGPGQKIDRLLENSRRVNETGDEYYALSREDVPELLTLFINLSAIITPILDMAQQAKPKSSKKAPVKRKTAVPSEAEEDDTTASPDEETSFAGISPF